MSSLVPVRAGFTNGGLAGLLIGRREVVALDVGFRCCKGVTSPRVVPFRGPGFFLNAEDIVLKNVKNLDFKVYRRGSK
jgi:hypothetical protein